MIEMTCEALDEYLLDELLQTDRSLFEEHLQNCLFCQEAVDLQSEIDAEFRSLVPAVIPPDQIIQTALQRIHISSGRQQATWAVLCTVLCVVAACFIALRPGPQVAKFKPQTDLPIAHVVVSDKVNNTTNAVVALSHTELNASSLVNVTFSGDLLTLPIETGRSDVTLIQVFPTVATLSPAD